MAKSLAEMQLIRERLKEKIGQVLNIAAVIGADGKFKLLAEKYRYISEENFYILVVGEFKRGKSTLINAMLGEKILPAKVAPCTGIITEIRYGAEKKAELYKRNQTQPSKTISPEEIRHYIEINLDDDGSVIESEYERIVLYYPLSLCKNNVTLVDSPGLNESELRTDLVRKYLPKIDAAILVLGCDQFYTMEEKRFLDNQIAEVVRQCLFIVANRCDELEDEEDEQDIQARAKNYLRDKLEQPWQERFYFCSAKQALINRSKGINNQFVTQFKALESAIEKFLVEKRASAKIEGPAKIVGQVLLEIRNKELKKYGDLYQQSLEELKKKQQLIERPLMELEKQKKTMLDRTDRSRRIFIEKIPIRTESLIKGLPSEVISAIESIPEDQLDLPITEKGRQELWQKVLGPAIDKRLHQRYRKFIYELQQELQEHLDELQKKLQEDVKEFYEKIRELRGIIFDQNDMEKALPTTAFETIFGTTSGLIIGGGIGGGVAWGLLLLGVTSLYLLLPVGLMVGILASIMGVKFGQNLIREKFRQQLLAKLPSAMMEKLDKKQLDHKITQAVEDIYNEFGSGVSRELQQLIDDELGKLNKVEQEKRQAEQTWAEKEQEIGEMRRQLTQLDNEIEDILKSF